MIIYSVPSAATPYRLELPEIGKDFWIPDQKILENEYIATSTASAGFFRQLVKYDESSIKKQYTVVLDEARALLLQTMIQSTQTSWYCHNGTATYHINLLASLAPIGPTKASATLQISVIEAIS